MKQEKLGSIDIAMAGLAIFALSLLVVSIVFELTPEQEGVFGVDRPWGMRDIHHRALFQVPQRAF